MGQLTVLRHCTPVRNVRSILSRGLDPARSRGRLRAVWLHAPSKTPWAIPHVAQRHSAPEGAVVVLKVAVPRRWLSRRGKGCWTCDRLIPPAQIVSVLHPAAVA